MLGDITANEVEMLNAFTALGPGGQRDLKDYTRYLLSKQYQKEVKTAVFHNKLLHNLFHSLLHIVEKDDFDINQVTKRMFQIKDLYYGIFEQVHTRYSELISDLDSNELVREFARNGFNNLEAALHKGNTTIIRLEIIDFFQDFNKHAQRRDARQIVAV